MHRLTKREKSLMETAFKAGCEIQSVAECKLKMQVRTFWGWRPFCGVEVLNQDKNFEPWLKYYQNK